MPPSIGTQVEAAAAGAEDIWQHSGASVGEGKLAKVIAGTYVIYATNKQKITCRIGKVLTVTRAEQMIVVHQLHSMSD